MTNAARPRLVPALTAGAVVVAAVVAGAAVLRDDAAPRDTARAVAAGTATPTPSASPTTAAPSAAATTPAAPTVPAVGDVAVPAGEFVALLADGRLVTASARDGRVTRTILRDATTPRRPRPHFRDAADVALSPDRRTVFLSVARAADGAGCDAPLEQVDVGSGRRTRIGTGTFPDVSPDGTRLAYVTGCGDGWVVVRDLRTGSERRIAHRLTTQLADGTYAPPWSLERAVWRADGRLWVVAAWENVTELRVVSATARTTDGEPVRTGHTTYALDRRGADLVYLHSCCYTEEEEGEDAIVLRTAAGAERRLVRAPDERGLAVPVAGPGGDLLYERSGRLFRYHLTTGRDTDLGAVTALARDW